MSDQYGPITWDDLKKWDETIKLRWLATTAINGMFLEATIKFLLGDGKADQSPCEKTRGCSQVGIDASG